MPKQKDLKRRVRSRMRKIGESYTTARAQVVKKKTVDYAAIAGISDEAVKAKTGCGWKRWVGTLDGAKAAEMPHKEIARFLRDRFQVSGWWSQMITVGYERIRGLREKGQRRGGGFDVNKSKTFAVPIGKLYSAFGARNRKRWLGKVKLTIKKATREKSMRLTFEDGTPVEAYFWKKGPQKSQVQVQHRQRKSKADADKIRTFWTERLKTLGEVLTG